MKYVLLFLTFSIYLFTSIKGGKPPCQKSFHQKINGKPLRQKYPFHFGMISVVLPVIPKPVEGVPEVLGDYRKDLRGPQKC